MNREASSYLNSPNYAGTSANTIPRRTDPLFPYQSASATNFTPSPASAGTYRGVGAAALNPATGIPYNRGPGYIGLNPYGTYNQQPPPGTSSYLPRCPPVGPFMGMAIPSSHISRPTNAERFYQGSRPAAAPHYTSTSEYFLNNTPLEVEKELADVPIKETVKENCKRKSKKLGHQGKQKSKGNCCDGARRKIKNLEKRVKFLEGCVKILQKEQEDNSLCSSLIKVYIGSKARKGCDSDSDSDSESESESDSDSDSDSDSADS